MTYMTILLIVSSLILLYLLIRIPNGAPFFRTDKTAIQTMMTITPLHAGEKAVDIGSGDGELVLALTKHGLIVDGYEINPLLVFWSRHRIAQEGLSSTAHIHLQNLWKTNFSQYTIVTLYGVPSMMTNLEKKLQKELPAGARVISNTYPFPTWKSTTTRDNVYLYTKQ